MDEKRELIRTMFSSFAEALEVSEDKLYEAYSNKEFTKVREECLPKLHMILIQENEEFKKTLMSNNERAA